jgi:HEAT repeat protein
VAIPTLRELLLDKNPEIAAQAAAAVIALGGDPLEPMRLLVETLIAQPQGAARWALLKLTGPQLKPAMSAVEQLLTHREEKIRLAAAEILIHASPESARLTMPLLSAIIDEEKDEDSARSRAALSLFDKARHSLTGDVVPMLTRKLQSAPSHGVGYFTRESVLGMLEEVGPDARAAVPDIVKLQKTEEKWLDAERASPRPDFVRSLWAEGNRLAAARALVRIDPKTPGAVPVLIASLRHESRSERIRTALILARVGPRAADALPGLRAALDDEEAFVRAAAATAMLEITAVETTAGPVLKNEILHDPATMHTIYWMQYLSNYKPDLRDKEEFRGRLKLSPLTCGVVVSALRQALSDSDETRRAWAATELGYLGPVARDSWPDLQRLARVSEMKNPNEPLPPDREAALTALGKIQPGVGAGGK